ncbi:tubulin delta chain [Plakobranchus ocellatus]|uniref:Tubulin delta chain n=1 Tax=Plakobranchus ocellatus TaxID=259542 RepID=A0AAV3XXW2_9GAST|nr:tubulin delta chain [Plakobranchus ocellatus]
MSTVHMHIGQCGNQLSIPLWKTFFKFEEENKKALLMSLDGNHRSIHIDSEHKVVSSIPKTFKLRDKNVIVGKRGRGTNFALGYHGLKSVGDDHLLHDSMEALRKEIERCDMYTGTVVYHSLSGGTGSGLGARVTESLRDYYPSSHILSCVVAPCASGESPLQNFNALLALHHFQMFTDAIILLNNDFYLSYLNKRHEDSPTYSEQVSFKNVNEIMANALCGIFLPTETLSVKKETSIGQEPWELVRNTAPLPSAKFITLAQHTSTKLSWEGITSKLLQTFPRYSSLGSPNSCLAATVVGRGDADNIFMTCVQTNLEKKIKKAINFVQWNPYPLDCWSARNNCVGPKKSSSMTLAANTSAVQDYLERVLMQSRLKLQSGAYVHWYHRYGVCQEMFNDSIESLQNVVDTYTELTKT